ncbi:MAG: hypothetical protein D6744_06590 [Planctomycetota bacterium]|nr:MAG: hypothetical protein D6744_06590 [Planctomycetota bacterium]
MQTGSSATLSLEASGVLDHILDEMRAGRLPNVDELIAQHPQHADDIRQLFHVLQFVQDAAVGCEPANAVAARLTLGAPPAKLGDFRVVREIGRGGMGVVYEAVQESLDRRVALKVLLPGAGGLDRATRRFMREARTGGALQHRHIVPVLAVGEHDGIPYYAMQYIEGESLASYVKRRRRDDRRPRADDFRRIARWGAQVAGGLEYAHQRGVLHRDIKPANLLLDGDENVWIADFGLARTDAGATLTLSGDVLGTVRYMSPEQARGGRRLDERSDIYSLGVSLYELACLRPPFDGPDRESTLKQVLMDDPPRLRRLNGDVPRPLERIIQHAIAKEPAERYPSAALLAEDLQRFLDDKPLLMRPTSLAAQLRRLAARHRTAFAFALTVLALLAGFGVVMAVQSALLARQRDEARQAQQRADQEAHRAAVAAQTAEQQSQFLRDMLAAADPHDAGGDVTVREVLDEAAAAAGDALRDRPAVQGAIRDTLGRSYRGLGLYESAEQQLRAALELRQSALGDDAPETLRTMNSLGMLLVERGDAEEAMPLLEESLARQRALLGADHPDTIQSLSNLAAAYYLRGRFDEALPILDEALASATAALGEESDEALALMNTLGTIYGKLGRYDDSAPLLARCLNINRRVHGPEHPLTLSALNNYARLQEHSGHLEEAEALSREVLDLRTRVLGPQHPETLSAMNNLGTLLRRVNKLDEAESLLRDALRGRGETLGDDHPDTLASVRNLASLLRQTGDTQAALELFQHALDGFARAMPENAVRIAIARFDVGDCLLRLQRYDEAEPLLLDAYDDLRDNPTVNPRWPQAVRKRLAELYESTNRPQQAAQWRDGGEPDADD